MKHNKVQLVTIRQSEPELGHQCYLLFVIGIMQSCFRDLTYYMRHVTFWDVIQVTGSEFVYELLDKLKLFLTFLGNRRKKGREI